MTLNASQLHKTVLNAPLSCSFKAKMKNQRDCYGLTMTTEGIRDSVKYT